MTKQERQKLVARLAQEYGCEQETIEELITFYCEWVLGDASDGDTYLDHRDNIVPSFVKELNAIVKINKGRDVTG